MSFRRVAPLGFALGLFAACQGASSSDLFEPPVQPGIEAGTSSGAPSSSSGASGGALPDSGESSSSSGDLVDAAPDAPVVDLDPTGVFCGDVGYCSEATPLCCPGKPGSGALNPYACKAACATTEATIECDDDDDCGGGQICCVAHNGVGVPQTISCKAVAECAPSNSVSKMCDLTKLDSCATYKAGTFCQQHVNMAAGFALCADPPP